MVAQAEYRSVWDVLNDMDTPDHALRKFTTDYFDVISGAWGSTSNHQAWPGGYLHHIVECLNIGYQLFDTLNHLRPLPFTLKDALQVLFLHDIEKVFNKSDVKTPLGTTWKEYLDVATERQEWFSNQLDYAGHPMVRQELNVKYLRREFRAAVILHLGIKLSEDQWAALEYIESEREDYTSAMRRMNELGAFCHCCDIISARLWHDKGAICSNW